jgi:hypothetical protein
MEEIPVLSNAERAKLANALKQAEARIQAGKGIEHESKAFKERLLRVYRGRKR